MANTIKVKRGQSANLNSLTLQPGEIAVTLDTKNIYVGDESGAVQQINTKGDTGNSGVYIGTAAPTDESVNVWINPEGEGIEIKDNTLSNIDLSQCVESGFFVFGEGITDNNVTENSIAVPLNPGVGFMTTVNTFVRREVEYYHMEQAIVTGGVFYVRMVELVKEDLSISRITDWLYRGLSSVMMEERFAPYSGYLEPGDSQEWEYPDLTTWNPYSVYVLSKEKISSEPISNYIPIEVGQNLSNQRLYLNFPEPLDNYINYYPGLFTSDTYTVQELFSNEVSRIVVKRNSDAEIIKTLYQDAAGEVSTNLESYKLPSDFGVVTSVAEGMWGTSNEYIKIESTEWPGVDASNDLKVELFNKTFKITNINSEEGCEYKVLLARIY